jgi:hypothetical protein
MPAPKQKTETPLAPHCLKQLMTGDHAPGLVGQVTQHLKLAWFQADTPMVEEHSPSGQINA